MATYTSRPLFDELARYVALGFEPSTLKATAPAELQRKLSWRAAQPDGLTATNAAAAAWVRAYVASLEQARCAA